jgi:hypothetical protein
MQSLPLELLHQLAVMLPIPVLKLFRLVCRAFALAGAPCVLKNLHIHSYYYHLKFLEELARREGIAKGVKALHYTDEIVSSPKASFEDFREHYDRLKESLNGQIFQEADLRQQYRDYEVTYENQPRLLKNSVDVSTIETLIKHLPALKKVTINTQNEYPEQFKRGWNPYTSPRISPNTGERKQVDVGVRGLGAVIGAVHSAGTTLHELHVGLLSPKFFSLDNDDLLRVSHTLKCLNILDLRIDTGHEEFRRSESEGWNIRVGTKVSECREIMRMGQLKSLLIALPLLASLCLRFNWRNEVESPEGWPAKLSWLFNSQYVWPALKAIDLGMIISSEQELFELLDRHRSTLRDVVIRSYCLHPGSWVSLLPKLKTSLELDQAWITGDIFGYPENSPDELWCLDFDENLEDAVGEYVSGRTETLPLIHGNMFIVNITV